MTAVNDALLREMATATAEASASARVTLDVVARMERRQDDVINVQGQHTAMLQVLMGERTERRGHAGARVIGWGGIGITALLGTLQAWFNTHLHHGR